MRCLVFRYKLWCYITWLYSHWLSPCPIRTLALPLHYTLDCLLPTVKQRITIQRWASTLNSHLNNLLWHWKRDTSTNLRLHCFWGTLRLEKTHITINIFSSFFFNCYRLHTLWGFGVLGFWGDFIRILPDQNCNRGMDKRGIRGERIFSEYFMKFANMVHTEKRGYAKLIQLTNSRRLF